MKLVKTPSEMSDYEFCSHVVGLMGDRTFSEVVAKANAVRQAGTTREVLAQALVSRDVFAADLRPRLHALISQFVKNELLVSLLSDEDEAPIAPDPEPEVPHAEPAAVEGQERRRSRSRTPA